MLLRSCIFQFLVVASVSYTVYCACTSDDFVRSGIVPDVVPDLNTFESPLEVYYGGTPLVCGNKHGFYQNRHAPTLVYGAETDSLYTVLMISTDLANEKYGIILNWLVANVPGGDVFGGDVLKKYRRTILRSEGSQKYILLVYRQSNKEMKLPLHITSRFKFDLDGFVKNQTLQGPVAGAFF